MSILQKIKALFEAEVIEATFKDAKTKDGSIIRIEGDIKEGSIASLIAEDGSVTPAPVGDLELEDGTVLTIGDAGAITAIVTPKTPEAEMSAPEVPVEAPATETPEVAKEEVDKVAALEAKVAELEAAIAMCADQIKSLMDGGPTAAAEMADVKKENKSLKKQVKELAAEPATPAVAFKKVEAIEVAKSNKKSNVNSELMSKIVAIRENIIN